MHNRFLYTAEVVFYDDVGRYGYRIYARTVNDPFLILLSPGKYLDADSAIRASESEIQNIKARLLARDIRKGVRRAQNMMGGAA